MWRCFEGKRKQRRPSDLAPKLSGMRAAGSREKGGTTMRYLKYFLLLGVLMAFPLVQSQAQVRVGVGVGFGPGYVGGPPACAYGYYDYAPYACAPYGYYGSSWFANGIFIGAGPWYHGYGWGRGYYGRGYYGRAGWGVGRGYNGGRGLSRGERWVECPTAPQFVAEAASTVVVDSMVAAGADKYALAS